MAPLPISLFTRVFPTQADLDNPGHYLCRFCGKPTTMTRRRYYCSDKCYDFCQEALSWELARRLTWERDGKKCVLCDDPLRLHGEDGAEIHHIIPVRELWRLAWDVAMEPPFEELHWRKSYWDPDKTRLEAVARERAFALVYALLYLDINNLQTLCIKCHNIVHSADYRNQSRVNLFMVAPTYWANFWRWAERDRVTKTLDDFFK